MFPKLPVGTGYISSYNLMLLSGIFFGWLAYAAEENRLWSASNPGERLRVFATSTIAYLIVVAFCIHGAMYFHFVFDNIPQSRWDKITFWRIVFPDPLHSTKVLYGVFFFFPMGIALVSLASRKVRFYDLLNRKAFIVFLVVGFARVGCFLNGCCYGIRSETFGVRFPMGSAVSWEHYRRGFTKGFLVPPSLPVIPTQAISAVFLFGLFAFALRATVKKKPGIFMHYVFYYAIFRFLIEFLRDDLDRAYYGPLSASQWISLFVFVTYGLWRRFFPKSSSSV